MPSILKSLKMLLITKSIFYVMARASQRHIIWFTVILCIINVINIISRHMALMINRLFQTLKPRWSISNYYSLYAEASHAFYSRKPYHNCNDLRSNTMTNWLWPGWTGRVIKTGWKRFLRRLPFRKLGFSTAS